MFGGGFGGGMGGSQSPFQQSFDREMNSPQYQSALKRYERSRGQDQDALSQLQASQQRMQQMQGGGFGGGFQSQGPQDLRQIRQRQSDAMFDRQGRGGRGNQGQDMKIDIDQFQAKPSPPVAMNQRDMTRLQGRGFGGGFQSQGPQDLRGMQARQIDSMFQSQGPRNMRQMTAMPQLSRGIGGFGGQRGLAQGRFSNLQDAMRTFR
tara:strand:- start:118 stop:735 length:618 start_codon:yes stop_codon:yes gene_type:complete